MIRTPLLAALALLSLVGPGCKNHCETLVDKVCASTPSDLTACDGLPAEPDDKPNARCEAIRRYALTCTKELPDKAKQATAEDLVACKANLEIARELEKAAQ